MLLTLLVVSVIILIVVVLAVIIIDKTFTGDAAPFAWIAKVIVGLLALIEIVNLLNGSGLLHF